MQANAIDVDSLTDALSPYNDRQNDKQNLAWR